MVSEKQGSKTFKDEMLEKYHSIPSDVDLDPRDLNEEFADLLIINDKLRAFMRKCDKWDYSDFGNIYKILTANAFAEWEINRIFEAYSPDAWAALPESSKRKIRVEGECTPDVLQDPFDNGLDLFPFKVDNTGIYGVKRVEKDEKVEYEPYLITKTPVIITHICESLDDDGEYKCKIKYKSMSRKIHTRYVEPSMLLSCDVKTLGNMGIVVIDDDTKKMKQYFKKTLDLDNQLPIEYTANKNGWFQGNSVLVTGKYKHTPYGMEEIAQLSEFLHQGHNVKGT